MKLYALFSPSGVVELATTSTDYDICCEKSYNVLYGRYRWPASYWRNWDGFIAERKRRGWLILEVTKGKEAE